MKPTLAVAATLALSTLAAVVHADPLTCRVAVAIVVDKSAAMAASHGMDNMKNATRGAVDTLTQDDCYTIVAFDSKPTVVVPLRGNPSEHSATAPVENLTASGTLDIFSALDAAHKALVTVPSAKKRHVMLMTVGRSPSTAPLQQLLATMKTERITVSVFGAGTAIDENMLKTLSTTTGGRYLAVPEVRHLPTAFSQEVQLALAP